MFSFIRISWFYTIFLFPLNVCGLKHDYDDRFAFSASWNAHIALLST